MCIVHCVGHPVEKHLLANGHMTCYINLFTAQLQCIIS